jgi:uncharacterized protein (DUF433 family)
MIESNGETVRSEEKAVPTARPVARGTRVAVHFVLELMAEGWTPQEISRHFGHIADDDARAAGLEAADLAPAADCLEPAAAANAAGHH